MGAFKYILIVALVLFSCVVADVGHDIIIAGETAAVKAMGITGIVNIPVSRGRNAVTAEIYLHLYGITFIERVDDVLIKVELPTGFYIARGEGDHRHMALHDADGTRIANIFLKDTPYDYYGRTDFI